MANYPRLTNLYKSIGAGSTGVVNAGAGVILVVSVININDADRFLQFFDTLTPITTGAVPFAVYPVYQKNGYTELTQAQMGKQGLIFDVGITWGFSSVASTYQPTSPADAILNIHWT